MPSKSVPADATPAVRVKRVRRDPEEARRLIVETTERLMLREGYAAVTTRRVAKEAGLAPALVHYYFATTDDLMAALHDAATVRQRAKLAAALASDRPLHALWDTQTHSSDAPLGVELAKMAAQRPALRRLIVGQADESRAMQAEVIRNLGVPLDLGGAQLTPESFATVLVALARLLINEEAVGIRTGHADLRAFVAEILDRLEPGEVSDHR